MRIFRRLDDRWDFWLIADILSKIFESLDYSLPLSLIFTCAPLLAHLVPGFLLLLRHFRGKWGGGGLIRYETQLPETRASRVSSPCYNPRMKARRSSSGKGVLRERRRQARLSRVALLATGEKERERRIEVAAAKSAAARAAGLPPSRLPPEQAAKFRAAMAAVQAGDIPACISCGGAMTLNGDIPGGRWECPGGCFAFSVSAEGL